VQQFLSLSVLPSGIRLFSKIAKKVELSHELTALSLRERDLPKEVGEGLLPSPSGRGCFKETGEGPRGNHYARLYFGQRVVLSVCLLLALSLAGCVGAGDSRPAHDKTALWPKPPSRRPLAVDGHTALPPLIPNKVMEARNPDRPASGGFRNPARLISKLESGGWTDLPSAQTPQGSQMVSALTRVQVRLGLLQPGQPDSVLQAQAPITQGTWGQWLLAYRDPSQSWEKVSPTQALIRAQSMGLVLPDIKVADPVTRLQVCQAYLQLTDPPKAQLEALDPSEAAPVMADAFETADQIKGWRWLTPPEQQAVLWAYQQGLLAQVFALTPQQLIEGSGLQAQQPITRGEALLFLNALLG
jgi:hypothetical protein